MILSNQVNLIWFGNKLFLWLMKLSLEFLVETNNEHRKYNFNHAICRDIKNLSRPYNQGIQKKFYAVKVLSASFHLQKIRWQYYSFGITCSKNSVSKHIYLTRLYRHRCFAVFSIQIICQIVVFRENLNIRLSSINNFVKLEIKLILKYIKI